jgi:subtilase family serine protease
LFGSIALLLGSTISAFGSGPSDSKSLQSFSPASHTPLITQHVDESKLVTLTGGTHPSANAENDRGLVNDQLQFEHIFLQLKRSPAQQAAFDQFVASQHDRKSANFHQWLTADEIGTRFGIAQADIDSISNWLRNRGFTVKHVYPNMAIDFSGNAGQIREAFHTEIHNLEVSGEKHYANMSDPKMPAAFAPAVVGLMFLDDFQPKPMSVPKTNDNIGGGNNLVTVSDLHTIYNFGPVYSAGHTGTGMTIAIISASDAYNSTGATSDWNVFRNTLGIPTTTYTHASLTTVHPSAGTNFDTACSDPGVTGAEGEAAIDVEWSAAAAPDAAIELVACTNIYVGMDNILTNGGTLPNILSISYGYYEAGLGTTNSFLNSVFETASSEGVSIFVSSGDSGADVRDQDAGVDTNGINVSGISTTPYNVAVGGTDFGDNYAGTSTTYWNSSNNTYYGSAKSYVPEIPWNDSCGSQLFAKYISGSSVTYGSGGFCNSSTAKSDGLYNNAGGSGGPSTLYSKPSWQSLVGVPADSARDVPDVALFAANGYWGHYYVVCWSDTANGGSSCSGTPDTWAGFGGTSVAAPIWAGIQALIDESTGKNWGNPNTEYYSIAKTEYGSSGSSTCNSTLGNGTSSTCVFYDVTLGDNDMPCTGTKNCYLPSGTQGVLSTSNTAYQPAYVTTTGYDFPTGIGTPNVANLVAAFAPTGTPATMTSPTNGSTLSGSTVTFTWNKGTGVKQYLLYVGSVVHSDNIDLLAPTTATTVTYNNIPTTGGTLYVTLFSLIGTTWVPEAYTYKEAPPSPATMTSPTNGSTLTGSTVTFDWKSNGASQFLLYVGTTLRGDNIAQVKAGTALTATVSNIPLQGKTLYVTLFSLVGSTWESEAYTYTEKAPSAATMATPAPDSVLPGSSVTFTWNSNGATQYLVYVGTTLRGDNIAEKNTGSTTSLAVTGIPTSGKTLYVTLFSLVGSTWESEAYTYTEATAAAPDPGPPNQK